MAWIEKEQRRDGDVSARVVWRLGGTREGAYQSETFGAGSDAQNLARADGFKKMVDAAGQRWPDGWVKAEGFVRPKGESDPLKAPPRFVDIGEEYVRQIVDVSPGQRKRYLGQLPRCSPALGCAARWSSPAPSRQSTSRISRTG